MNRYLPRFLALPAAAALLGAPLLPGLAASPTATAAPAVFAQETPVDTTSVEVLNPDGELSDTETQTLRGNTAELDFPAEVTRVTHLILGDNDANLNDTVVEFGEQQHPELLNPAQDRYAPGQLIIAVGLDPRQMGVYCGDDVCEALGIYEAGTTDEDMARLDGILDEMEGPLSQGNWVEGMLAGAQAAADPTVRRESGDGVSGSTAAVIAASVVVLSGGAGAFGVAHHRRKTVQRARERHREVSENYGRVARDLDAIDVRAHSLSSPLADDALRGQWREVKEKFLGLHTQMDSLTGLTADAPDKEFRRKAGEIEQAHETVTQMAAAEDNIEELARMEHGDHEVRRRELTTLHEDILAAEVRADAEDAALGRRLRELDDRVLALRDQLDDPAFMDRYADLLVDNRVLNEAVQEKMYADLEKSTEHAVPRLHDRDWRPGYGYQHYVPFAVVNSWHQADSSAAQAAASSANTSYSSPGFAGGGGSRGF